MRLLFALGLLCALTAPAQGRGRRCHGDCPPIGIEYEFSFGFADLSLANQTFSDSFTPLTHDHQTLPPETVTVRGRNIGAIRPRVLVGELHLSLMRLPHLSFGMVMGVLGGDLGKPVEIFGGSGAGAIVDPHSASGIAVGPEVQTVWSRGPFEARAGIAMGYREEDLPIINRLVTCKGGLCPATASSAQFYLEPRITLAVNLPRVVSIGGYVGGDVMPTGGFVAGGFIALRLIDWDKLGDMRTYSDRGLYH